MRELQIAVLEWTRARLRWEECVMSTVGSPEFVRLLPERAQRHRALMVAQAELLRVGNQLLLEEGRGPSLTK